MPREVIEKREVTIPEAKEILEARIREGEALDLQRKTYAYLQKFSKCRPEKAGEVVEKLVERYGLKREVAIMLVNILPETVDEARTILTVEDKVFTSEEISEILEVLKECREE